jgi:hypothetical protein
VVDPEPVEMAHPVEPEEALVEEVVQLELAAQEVALELLAVQVVLIVYFGLEDVADLGVQ